MFHCPVGVCVIEQRAIILSATVRSPTVLIQVPLYIDNFMSHKTCDREMPCSFYQVETHYPH